MSNNTIPPMIHPFGKHWSQPDRSEIIIDEFYATMSQEACDKLKNYSMSTPTGAYAGKMWKRSGATPGTWILMWWDTSPDNPEVCRGNFREIKIK